MILRIYHPKVAAIDCETCKKFHYDEKWDPVMIPADPSGRTKKHMPRGPRDPLACSICPKIPLGAVPVPKNAVELSPKNYRAWRHYLECRAVGKFPDDPIVRRNASILRELYDEYDRHYQIEALAKWMKASALHG